MYQLIVGGRHSFVDSLANMYISIISGIRQLDQLNVEEDQQVGLRRAVNRLPEERPTDPTQLSRRQAIDGIGLNVISVRREGTGLAGYRGKAYD